MLDRRRSSLRRSLTACVMLAILSGILLGMIELAYVFAVRRPLFDSFRLGALFAVLLVCIPAAFGGLIGIVQGVIAWAVSDLTFLFSKQRLEESKWTARLYSVLALPLLAVFTAYLFSGRRAGQIPGKDGIALAIGLLGVAMTYLGFRIILYARDQFRQRRWGMKQATMLSVGLLGCSISVYLADYYLLPRLYPFLHVGIALSAWALAQLAIASFRAGFRPQNRWIGKWLQPGRAFFIFVAIMAFGAWGLRRYAWYESLRFLAHEHTAVQSKLVQLARRAGLPIAGTVDEDVTIESVSPLAAQNAVALKEGPRLPNANVLLISIDALRADHMGLYGYGRNTTPNIDRWAKESTVFERGYCAVPHTSFSLTSLLTGTNMFSKGIDAARPVPKTFQRYGYKTAGFFPPAVFYIDGERFRAFERSAFDFEYAKYEFLAAADRVDQIKTFLDREKPERFFIWLHLFEPHEPYELRRDFFYGHRAMDRYDGEIAYIDDQIGKLIAWIQKTHPQTIIALTADHGEAFGEHGSYYHGNTLYEEQVRIPLIVHVPGVAGRRVDGAAQSIDLLPTLLSLIDVPVPAEMQGRDLGPWFVGESEANLLPAFTEMLNKKAVIHKNHKLIVDTQAGFSELYDLAQDPGELRNRAMVDKVLVRTLKASLEQQEHGTKQRYDPRRSIEEVFSKALHRDAGTVPHLLRIASYGDGDERRRAFELLVHLRVADRDVRQLFLKGINSVDLEIKLRSTVGAALLGEEKAIAELPTLLERNDLPPVLRRDGYLALALSGNREVTLELSRELDHSDDIYDRLELISTLGKLGDERSAPSLIKQLDTHRTRLYALRALGDIKAREAIPLLIASVQNDTFTSWREASSIALGKMSDPRARDALRSVLIHEAEPGVVVAAMRSLHRIKKLPEAKQRGVLQATSWRCSEGRCEMAFEASCLRAHELLFLVENKDPSFQVLCGDRVMALGTQREQERVGETMGDASLVSLTQEGGLRFVSKTDQTSVLFVMLRAAPIKEDV